MSRQAIQGHGATERELEFVDLRDAGLSIEESAASMGISFGLAKSIDIRMFPTLNDDRAFEAMIREGSRLLARRLREVRV